MPEEGVDRKRLCMLLSLTLDEGLPLSAIQQHTVQEGSSFNVVKRQGSVHCAKINVTYKNVYCSFSHVAYQGYTCKRNAIQT